MRIGWPTAGGDGGTDAVDDGADRVALVGVDAAEEDEHAEPGDVDGPDRAAMAGDRRRREPSDVHERELGAGRAEQVGCVCPP